MHRNQFYRHTYYIIRTYSFWGLCPRPPLGLCPWTPLGDFGPSGTLLSRYTLAYL